MLSSKGTERYCPRKWIQAQAVLLDNPKVTIKTCHTLHPTTLLRTETGPGSMILQKPQMRSTPDTPTYDVSPHQALTGNGSQTERGEGADRTRRDGQTQVTEARCLPQGLLPEMPNPQASWSLRACDTEDLKCLHRLPDACATRHPQTWGLSLSGTTEPSRVTQRCRRSGLGENQTQLKAARSSSALPPVTMRTLPPGRTQHRRQTCSLSTLKTKKPDEGRRRGLSVTSKAP